MGSKFSQKKEFKILATGLDESGKTKAIHLMKCMEDIETTPTIGYNLEVIFYKGNSFTIWDAGGQDKIRVLWKHYYQGLDGIMLFVDSSDKDRIEDAADELRKMIAEEELENCPFLIMANKQDLENALPPEEITKLLGMEQIKGREWIVQGSSAITGQGLKEGFEWLANTLISKRKNGKKTK